MKQNRSIKLDTLKALLAKSGNQCAFPGCTHPLFNENNLFIAQLAHISGVSANGPRYNPSLSSELRNSYDNLIFLCYRHHKEIDNSKEYTIEQIKKIKRNHEEKFKEYKLSISEEQLGFILDEINLYWKRILYINTFENQAEELRIEIKTD